MEATETQSECYPPHTTHDRTILMQSGKADRLVLWCSQNGLLCRFASAALLSATDEDLHLPSIHMRGGRATDCMQYVNCSEWQDC